MVPEPQGFDVHYEEHRCSLPVAIWKVHYFAILVVQRDQQKALVWHVPWKKDNESLCWAERLAVTMWFVSKVLSHAPKPCCRGFIRPSRELPDAQLFPLRPARSSIAAG